MKLSKKQLIAIKQTAEQYDLQLVLLFGSQVKGNIHPESDIDIAILPTDTLKSLQEDTLTTSLITILGNVDLTNLRTAGPLLMKEIFENTTILYEKNPLVFDTYYIYSLRRYAEARPLFDLTSYSLRKFTYGT